MKFVLIFWVSMSAGTGITVTAQTATFDDQPACEAAEKEMRKALPRGHHLVSLCVSQGNK